jgi:Cu-Zn family superoxide dismutase
MTTAILSAQTSVRPLIITLKGLSGSSVGTATFRTTISGKLNIDIELHYLPEGEHAVHIHQSPLCDGGVDFRTAGGHFNPNGKQHGTKNPMGHHNGDLPENVTVTVKPVSKTNWTTVGKANFTVDDLSLNPGDPNSILGRSIVVHDKPDDMKTDPTGNSGDRIACGVIEFPKSQ